MHRISHVVDELREQLDRPVFNPLIKRWVGLGELDYERYLATTELLNLQSPRSDLVSADELMFQIVHQAQELWLKLLAFELVEIVGELESALYWEATARLDRAHRIVGTLTRELNVLETLTPDAYQIIRSHLGDGSGQESPGYNAVRSSAQGLATCVDNVIAREQSTLESIYQAGTRPDLKRIMEQLVDLDVGFQSWLVAHFMLVRRTIGVDKKIKALDGVSSQVLPARMTKPLFPRLWQVRLELTSRWKREAGTRPGEPRSPHHQTSEGEPE